MNWLGSALQITSIALHSCILVLLRRRGLLRAFPFFSSYIIYLLLVTFVGAITLPHPHVYFYVYWTTAPFEVLLGILAVNESFWRVFRVFYLLRWFRILFPGGIVLALLYSVLRGFFSPPVHAGRLSETIISAVITAQYVILAISLGFFMLVKLLHVPWRIHEYRFVLGFGINAVATAFAFSVRSDFGTRFTFLREMLPAVVYVLIVQVIWLSAVAYPLPAKSEFAAEQLSPEEVVNRLRHELATIRSLLRRG
jgi:hypothetical protein